ncbi:hypothetical protein PROFUN_16724 [Planoprotostelium fungivorum]|uniref:Uncharacterized protein n=1 Tax=Planoprotostelium fungivorum TaxID=1890364 RepID=A0A2P6MPR1_9EUKA|nr:hypothetical protein PROFUN_16724 [Planoprotostelium fungivorum]
MSRAVSVLWGSGHTTASHFFCLVPQEDRPIQNSCSNLVTSGNWTMEGGDVEIDNQPTGFERCIPGTETKESDGRENARVVVDGCGTQLVVVLCLSRFFAVIRSERSQSFLVEAWIGPRSTKQLLCPLECSSGLSFFRRYHLRVVAVLSGDDFLSTVLLQVADEWMSVVDSLFLVGSRGDPLSCADNDRFFVGCGGTSLSLSGITSDGS